MIDLLLLRKQPRKQPFVGQDGYTGTDKKSGTKAEKTAKNCVSSAQAARETGGKKEELDAFSCIPAILLWRMRAVAGEGQTHREVQVRRLLALCPEQRIQGCLPSREVRIPLPYEAKRSNRPFDHLLKGGDCALRE